MTLIPRNRVWPFPGMGASSRAYGSDTSRLAWSTAALKRNFIGWLCFVLFRARAQASSPTACGVSASPHVVATKAPGLLFLTRRPLLVRKSRRFFSRAALPIAAFGN